MEDLPLGRIAALVLEFAMKDLPLGRTLMIIIIFFLVCWDNFSFVIEFSASVRMETGMLVPLFE